MNERGRRHGRPSARALERLRVVCQRRRTQRAGLQARKRRLVEMHEPCGNVGVIQKVVDVLEPARREHYGSGVCCGACRVSLSDLATGIRGLAG